jgi:hypothetical protein
MKLKRFFILGAALGVIALAAAAPPAMAAVSVGFSIHSGDPFHGFSLQLSSAPDVAWIPGTRVGYVQNYDGDLYSYGNQWYLDQDDQWYCASSYDGPFFEISASSLPFDVGRFPTAYHRGAFYRQQPRVVRGGYDRGYYDRNRSYGGNDGGWNQRDGRGSDWQTNQGWTQRDNRGYQGWTQRDNRGSDRRDSRGWNQASNRGRDRGWNRGQNGQNRNGGGDHDRDDRS